jgi:hypothetical protein
MMATSPSVTELTEAERRELRQVASSRTAPAGRAQRAPAIHVHSRGDLQHLSHSGGSPGSDPQDASLLTGFCARKPEVPLDSFGDPGRLVS